MNRIILLIFISFVIAFPIDVNSELHEKSSLENYNKIRRVDSFSQALEQTLNPQNYIVGPGDVFSFNMISTSRTLSIDLPISPTGNILIPILGSIYIDDLTLDVAIRKIKTKCLEKYPNADIYISIKTVRQIIINVTGAIGIKIGRVNATPLQRISDIFSIVKEKLDFDNISNENEISIENNDLKKYDKRDDRKLSLRNIILIRDGVSSRIDLLSYFILGDELNNPFLQSGDRIHFSFIDGSINLVGGVSLPGEYEFYPNQNLKSYIQLAGGYSIDSDLSFINITRIENDDLRREINFSNYEVAEEFIIMVHDHIIIPEKQEFKRQNIILIEGEINYPGKFTFDLGHSTVRDIIEKCGGLTLRADKNRIIINNELIESTQDNELNRILQIPPENRTYLEKSYIKARNGISKGDIVSSSQKFTNSIMDFKLNSGDKITIPERFDYVEIIGAVVYPGRYPYIKNNSFEKYIHLAGGLENNATRNKYIIKASTGQRMPASKNEELKRGDVIFIPEKIEYNAWERFSQIITVTSQIATTIIVIQNILER